jgi:hypothetical protein
MPTLRPFRLATRPAPRTARSSPPASTALALTIGLAFWTLTCGGSGGTNLVDQVCPTTTQRMMTSPAMTPTEFCQVYMQTCMGAASPPGGYITEAECEAAYTGLMFESTRECRSYHLCNAASYDMRNVGLHCQHTVGVGLCPDSGP